MMPTTTMGITTIRCIALIAEVLIKNRGESVAAERGLTILIMLKMVLKRSKNLHISRTHCNLLEVTVQTTRAKINTVATTIITLIHSTKHTTTL